MVDRMQVAEPTVAARQVAEAKAEVVTVAEGSVAAVISAAEYEEMLWIACTAVPRNKPKL
jgi:hypothetical protein